MSFSRLFRMRTIEQQAPAESGNPYLDARRRWNDHVAGVVSSNQSWQLIAILCLLIASGSLAGFVRLASQSKIVPYVVEVDKLGDAVAVRQALAAQPADPRVIRATVASFINDARMVTIDAGLQRAAVLRVYSLLATNDPATAKMNEWLNGSAEANPFKRAETEMVDVDIKSVLPGSGSTWQVDWVETVRDRKGAKKSEPYRMRSLVTVYVVPPTTEEQVRKNPLGIFVRDYSWAKQL
jgi:type IV secretory pathway TrbF-like protein